MTRNIVALNRTVKISSHDTIARFRNRSKLRDGGMWAMLRGLFRSDWVAYAKRPFGGAEHALRYLGCYTHRVAISNHRLVALEDGEVVFRWRDSAHKNKKRLMRLPLDEFLRRFF